MFLDLEATIGQCSYLAEEGEGLVLWGAVEEVQEVLVLVRERLEKRIGGDEMRVPCRKEREEHTRNQICSGHRVETRICVCWGRCQCHQRFSYLEAVGPGWAGTPGAAHSGEFDSLRSRSCSARRSPCRRHCPSGILQWPELGIAVQRCF